MHHHQLLKKISQFVEEHFRLYHNPEISYHNIDHTKYVVKSAEKIAEHYSLSGEDHFALIAAAWFHDTGYVLQPEGHELISAGIAKKFLVEHDTGDALINKISAMIMATRMPQQPVGLLEQILCDADLFHLGKDSFIRKSDELRKEKEYLGKRHISKSDWAIETLKLMEVHQYFTDYCRAELNAGSLSNMEKLKNLIHDHAPQAAAADEQPADDAKHDKHHEKATAKSKIEKPEKGIETMFRISSNNHSRLSDMADNKAHILITVNSIILSAVISLLLRKIDNNEYLAMPSFILLAVSLTAMTFAILATRPTIPNGEFSPEDIAAKKVNLLFFGNFYRMGLEAYRDAMLKIMDDHDLLYDNLIRDVYAQGVVLGRKYHLLRIAYNVFMYGLIVAVIAFIIAVATARPNTHNLARAAMVLLFPAGGF